MFFSVLFLCTTALNLRSGTTNSKASIRIGKLENRFRELVNEDTVILVDGDNVRGKTAFKSSKESLAHDLDIWTNRVGLSDRVCLMYDHGNEHEAFSYGALSVCFSGPGRSADDVIARDVVWLQRNFNCSVVVVTADSGLKTRCQQGSKITKGVVAFVDSTLFVELLSATVSFASADEEEPSLSDPADITAALAPFDPAKMNMLRRELGVRNQIKNIEKYVKGGGGKKQISKMKKRQQQLEDRLQRVIAQETMAGGVSLSATMDDALKLTPEQQQAGYETIIKMMRAGSTRGREETWERVLLAERFRNTLMASSLGMGLEVEQETQSTTGDRSSSSQGALATYVREINRNYSTTNYTAENLRLQALQQQPQQPQQQQQQQPQQFSVNNITHTTVHTQQQPSSQLHADITSHVESSEKMTTIEEGDDRKTSEKIITGAIFMVVPLPTQPILDTDIENTDTEITTFTDTVTELTNKNADIDTVITSTDITSTVITSTEITTTGKSSASNPDPNLDLDRRLSLQVSPLHLQILQQQRRQRELIETYQRTPKGPSARALEIAQRSLVTHPLNIPSHTYSQHSL